MQGDQLHRAGADNQERRVDNSTEHATVGEPEHSGTVEDHTVVMVREAPDQQLAEFECAQDFNRYRSRVAGWDEVKVGKLGMANGALPGKLAPQHVDQAVDFHFGVLLDENSSQAGPAQVDVE